ncbi:hypothetical protein [Luteolibacter soli]|uniref:Transmembrane protein n=1 Tax=Luteolibacter soli TaxID=3135280 RepID=A0ABU9AUR0_9BACT
MNENLPPPNRAIGWYRFIVWLLPSLVVPVLIALGLVIGGGIGASAAVGGGLFVLNSLGHLDARLSCHQRRVSPESPEAGRGWTLATYLILQIVVIVPVMTFALVYAICAATFDYRSIR